MSASIDVHQHLWPQGVVAALAARREPPYLDGDEIVLLEGRFPAGLHEHALQRRLEVLDRADVETALVSLQPSLGLGELLEEERRELEDIWLDGVRELAREAQGRLEALAPGRVADGCAGAILPARALLELERTAPLLNDLERRGDILFVHPGSSRPPADAPAWWASIVDYTAQMQAAYYAWLDRGEGRWPSLRVVFAILAGGAPFQLERLAPRGVDVRSTLDRNVFFDTATYGRRAIELCLETFGVHQLVYGSDVPVVDPQPTLDAVRGFGDSVHKIVTSDNPHRLLT